MVGGANKSLDGPPILHIGLPKTGTTAIQAELERHRHRSWIRVPQDLPGLSGDVLQSLIEGMPTSGLRVISHEGMLFNPESKVVQPTKKRIDWLQMSLSQRPFRIVIFVRPQLDWLESVYLFRVLLGEDLDPWDFWREHQSAELLHWSALIEQLDQLLNPVRLDVIPYVEGTDSVVEFFAVCGLALSKFPRFKTHHNPSIMARQVPILRLINRAADSAETVSKNRLLVQYQFAATEVPQESPFPDELQLEILKSFSGDFHKLVDMSSILDAESRLRLQRVEQVWGRKVLPFAGDQLSYAGVQSELIRMLQIASAKPPSLLQRGWRRLAEKTLSKSMKSEVN